MEIFTQFTTTNYTFLELYQGGVKGNTIKKETNADGVFKARDGLISNGGMETGISDASMHIRPDEAFVSEVDGNMVGHGIRCTKNGSNQTYRVVSQVEGFNFDSGVLEFYRLILKRESIAS